MSSPPPPDPRVSRETAGPGEAERPVSRETGLPTRIFLAPIRAYRRWISPLLGARCRYYPTCSAYAEEAVRTLGPARGIIVAAWRVLRCNPWSPGGLDPLENRRLFRPPPGAAQAKRAGGPSDRS